jgi:hypothetical protein
MTQPNVPAPGRWPTIGLLLVASLGVPISVVTLFEPWVKEHPGPSLGIAVAYWLAVLLGGTALKIWQKLESHWVDRAADAVDRRIQSIFSRYGRQYLRWIFYRYRDFDVKGLSTQGTYNLELEQVFVELTIEPRPAHAISGDPLRKMPGELAGRRQIWDYLRSQAIQGHLALIGPPGSGKTTLLQKIALQMTGKKRLRIRQTVPILLFLREHADTIGNSPSLSLAEVVRSSLSRKNGPVPPSGWLESHLENGRCLVLLDGLDEVAAVEVRSKVIAWVETQMASYPMNRFLVTSRPHGYRSHPLSGVTVLEVQPFARVQVERFVHNWYKANEIIASAKFDQGTEMKAHEGADDLLRRIGNSQTLTELAVNPLLLTMIATVHRYRSSLPGRRVELYTEICEVFLGKRQQARGLESDLTPAQKQRVLQPLAYYLMCSERRDVSLTEAIRVINEPLQRVAGNKGYYAAADFLKEIESCSGLMLEREEQCYSFAHLAFQEYLAASHAREESLGLNLVERVSEPWWHETLRLYAAQGDASQILSACLTSGLPSVGSLTLAVDCLEESREVDPVWRAKVDDFLERGTESSDPERFRLAAETLLSRRLRGMTAISDGVFADTAYVTHAEYQLFLDEKILEGIYSQPDHWNGLRFTSGSAMKPVLGVRYSDAIDFCKWLTLRDPSFLFRLPEESEAPNIHAVSSISAAGVAGYWIADRGATSRFRTVASRDESEGLSLAYFERLIANDLSDEGLTEAVHTIEAHRHWTRSLAHAFDHALDRARGFVLNLAKLDHLLLEIDSTLSADLNSLISPLRARGDQVADVQTLERGRSRARDLDRAFSRAMDRALARRQPIERKRDRNLARHRFYTSGWAIDLDRDLDLDHKNTGHRDRLFPLALALARDQYIEKALENALVAPPPRSYKVPELYRSLRKLARMASFGVAEPNYPLLVYSDLAILEARIDGILRSGEGLRIVKERHV